MDLPTGRVTFLFSDIEGSTRHAHRLGDDAWAGLLGDHDRLVDSMVYGRGGVVVKHEGDGAFAVFTDAGSAVGAAIDMALNLAGGALGRSGHGVLVRIGIHTGDGRLTDSKEDYVGIDVHYAARVAAAGNGGQIVISGAAHQGLVADPATLVPTGATIVDEGVRRLKDFDDPRPLYRVVLPGVTDDPRPLRTEDLPSNLPSLPTRFVGRQAEVAKLAEVMLTSRLLTLTGPGGTGKTRLGVSLAEVVRHRFGGGTWFIDLAPIRDPALVVGTIATELGVREEPGVTIASRLRDHLRSVEALLVLDNLEQLLPEAAMVVATLLRESAGLRLIVTSREILRVSGEREYVVPPLDREDGVKLFLDRAHAQRIDHDSAERASQVDVVRQIVDRLGGLPLAIELAAARTRLLSPATILERLGQSLDLLAGGARDLPERQRTLRGTITWSHDLLAADEQVIFRRLAVFNGGWTLGAAEAVVDPRRELLTEVVTGMESMADKSLVRIGATDHGEPRFERHVLIREYALERLDQAGERPDCERRHALTYLEVAEQASPHLGSSEADAWLDVLDHEEHNLRSALRWSLDVGQPDLGMRIAAAIWRFWQFRARLTEGLAWITELLAHPNGGDARARIGALSAGGGLAYWNGDFANCRALYTERLDLARALGDDAVLAEAHYEFGFLGITDQDIELVREHEEIALALFERLDDPAGMVRTRQALVLVRLLAGDYRAARDLETLNLAEFRRLGSAIRARDSLMLMAVASIFIDDLEVGRAYLGESMRLSSGIMSDQIAGLAMAAHLALRSDDPATGARLAGAAAAASEATGITNAALKILHVPDPADLARQRLGNAAVGLIAEGAAMPIEEALGIARALIGETVPAS